MRASPVAKSDFPARITQSLPEFLTWLRDLCNAETQKSHLN